MRKKTLMFRLLYVSVACAALFIAVPSPGNADADLPPDSGDGVQEQMQLLEVKATLKTKSSKMVKTDTNDQYAIDKSTLFIGENGQQVMIEYLKVPCEAQLLYEEKSDGSYFLHRLKVLSTHKKATNEMDDPPR